MSGAPFAWRRGSFGAPMPLGALMAAARVVSGALRWVCFSRAIIFFVSSRTVLQVCRRSVIALSLSEMSEDVNDKKEDATLVLCAWLQHWIL